MKLCVFEDDKFENFYPIALTRPVYCMKYGMEEIFRRNSRILGLPIGGTLTREYLAPLSGRLTGAPVNGDMDTGDDDWLFLNGRVLDPSSIPVEGPSEVGISGSDVVFVRADRESLGEAFSPNLTTFLNRFLETHEHVNVDVPIAGYTWDLVLGNSAALTQDFEMMGKTGIEGTLSQGSNIVGDDKQVYIAPTAQVDPLVVLDASLGPIYIDEGVRVFPHTRVEGPCFVGRDAQLVGGKIREGCTIGPVCRIGGEVEESIFHGYSNKYHDGFIGHAYVGEWVNLGALTTNSDLKNDYSSVQVFVKGGIVDTGSPKVGSMIGDHVKTGIGTLLNTGTVVGVMSILMPSGEVAPKNIPSFCLLIKNQIRGGLGLGKLTQTAKTVMSRRGVDLVDEDVHVLERVFEMTSQERESLIKRDRRKRSRSS